MRYVLQIYITTTCFAILPPSKSTKERHILNQLEIKDFALIYNIMELSFPSPEIRTYEKEFELFNHSNYHVLVSYNNNMSIDGFIAEWDYKEFRYLEHFAVHPSSRGSGLGTQMIREYLNQNKKPVYIEVESADNHIAKRRIKYYQRMGFFLSEIGYIQPPLKSTYSEVNLKIMTYPFALPETVLLKYKEKIFENVYKVCNAKNCHIKL